MNALRAFEVASRVGSFTVAARELHVSQGAISRHIAHLEQCLGVQLFDRGHREVRLTPTGALYANEVQIAFDRVQKATENVRSAKKRARLRVAIFPSIASRWLMPRLARFRAAHPDVELTISTSVDPDLHRDAIDIANFRGIPVATGVDFCPLFEVVLRPVCSPALLRGANNDPDILRQHLLLCSQNRIRDWQMWLSRAGVTDIDPRQGLKFENSALVYQAAIDGLGVAIAQMSVVQDDIAQGRLITPFALAVETGENYGLAWLSSKSALPGLREFREWFIAEALNGSAQTRAVSHWMAREPMVGA